MSPILKPSRIEPHFPKGLSFRDSTSGGNYAEHFLENVGLTNNPAVNWTWPFFKMGNERSVWLEFRAHVVEKYCNFI